MPHTHTSVKRVLARLVDQHHLARIPRLVGGDGGGSAQYVYQLGRQGHRFLGRANRYTPTRAVNEHTLAIVDCRVALSAAQPTRALIVLAFETEPSCHRVVGNVLLTPDAFVEIGIGEPGQGIKLSCWLEVDRATEHNHSQIRDKCLRYWHAYQQWSDDTIFPVVLFVVPDERRKAVIDRVIGGGPEEGQRLFRTCRRLELVEAIKGMATEHSGILL